MEKTTPCRWSVVLSIFTDRDEAVKFATRPMPIDPIRPALVYDWKSESDDWLLAFDGFEAAGASIFCDIFLQLNTSNKRGNGFGIRWAGTIIQSSDLVYSKHAGDDRKLRRQSSLYFEKPDALCDTGSSAVWSAELESVGAEFELHYDAMSYYDPSERCDIGQIYVRRARLSLGNSNSTLKRAISSEYHRITCMLQTIDRSAPYLSSRTQLYLGRAQQIVTHKQQQKRTYIWKSASTHQNDDELSSPRDGAFPGIGTRSSSPTELEELHDLQQISMTPSAKEYGDRTLDATTSSRAILQLPSHTTPDSDSYSNTNARLPFLVARDTDCIYRFKLFNFKFSPPRSAELPLRLGDFDARVRAVKAQKEEREKRRHKNAKLASSPFLRRRWNKSSGNVLQLPREEFTLEYSIADNVDVMFAFTIVDEGYEITSISIAARQYGRSLDMPHARALFSV